MRVEDYDYTTLATNQPNYNEAMTTNFLVSFKKFPGLTYFAQNVTIPSVSVNGIRTPFQNQRTYMPDNQIDFGQLTITFIVDEDFANYDTLFQEFLNQEKGKGSVQTLLHDLTVIRYSSNKVPISAFKFANASLTNLGSINYSTTGSESDLIVCDVSFNVTRMEIEVLRKANKKDGELNCNP